MKKSFTIFCQFFIFYFAFSSLTDQKQIFKDKWVRQEFVTIIGTNDIHGLAFPIKLTRTDTNQTYNYGGLPVMTTLINIIKSKNPGNVLYLDAGDQFQGGIQNSPMVSKGRIMNAFYDSIGVDGSAIGNHEFDFGYQFAQQYLSDRVSPNLAANLRSGDKSEFLPNQRTSKIFKLKNGISIGVIGLTTIATPSQSTGFAPPYSINNIAFLNYTDVVINESKTLKLKGVNAVIVVSHMGDNCFNDFTYGIWTQQTKQEQCKHQQMTAFIKSLPEGTIDAVVQGHEHTISHNYVSGIPIIGTTLGGYYLNVLQLKFKKGKLVKTWIEGPIPVCQRVFNYTNLCNYIPEPQKLQAAGSLVEWCFKGVHVKPDERLNDWLNNVWAPKLQPFERVLCQNQIYLNVSYDKETQLTNLIVDLLHNQIPSTQFFIGTPSAIRSDLYPGPIRYIELYNLLPFNLTMSSYQISAGDIIKILYILQSTEDAFYFTYGIQQTLFISKDKQTRGLVSVKWQNGTNIDPSSKVQALLPDILLLNIQYALQLANQPLIEIGKVNYRGFIRDALQKQLIKIKKIKANTYIDPNHPRMIVNIV